MYNKRFAPQNFHKMPKPPEKTTTTKRRTMLIPLFINSVINYSIKINLFFFSFRPLKKFWKDVNILQINFLTVKMKRISKISLGPFVKIMDVLR